MEELRRWVLAAGALVLALLILAVLVRAVLGPRPADRMTAVKMAAPLGLASWSCCLSGWRRTSWWI